MQIFCAALSLLAIFDFSLPTATDILSPGQTLTDGQVLACADQIYELGFFSPGNSTSKFLGIWYKATPDVVVWVANRENPIPAAEGGGLLALDSNGTLIISSSQGRIIWSSNSSVAASSPVLHLLNTGNLVVVDNSNNIWMSFDYPTDSRFPEMKMVDDSDAGLDRNLTSWKSPNDPSMGDFVHRIDNHVLPHTSIYKGNLKIYRSGPWNGKNFTGLPFAANRAFAPQLAFNNGRLVSLINPYNNSFYLRLTMNYTGLLQRYFLNEKRDGWILAYTMPSDTCDKYGLCGANSMCRPNEMPRCVCLNGFVPKSQKEWDEFTWRSGCTRLLPLDCRNEDGFKRFDSTKYPDTLSFRVETSMNADNCREECLRNCNCSAYADPYFSTEKIGCFLWFGDLVDIREFTGAVSIGPSIYIRVPKTEQGTRFLLIFGRIPCRSFEIFLVYQ